MLAAAPKHNFSRNHVLKFILVVTNFNFLRSVRVCALGIEQIDVVVRLNLHHELVNLLAEYVAQVLTK